MKRIVSGIRSAVKLGDFLLFRTSLIRHGPQVVTILPTSRCNLRCPMCYYSHREVHELGREAISFTGAQVGIVTDSSHTKAKIMDISTARIRKELKKGKVVIVAGFQGVNLDQEITTLGRGGSDMTAVALAKVLKARM